VASGRPKSRFSVRVTTDVVTDIGESVRPRKREQPSRALSHESEWSVISGQ